MGRRLKEKQLFEKTITNTSESNDYFLIRNSVYSPYSLRVKYRISGNVNVEVL